VLVLGVAQALVGVRDVRVAHGLHPHPVVPVAGELDVVLAVLGADDQVLVLLEEVQGVGQRGLEREPR
jgi:hypothetical protein